MSSDPKNHREWQEAANVADAMPRLDSARQYGLVTGGPEINVERCVELLKKAKQRGITPNIDFLS